MSKTTEVAKVEQQGTALVDPTALNFFEQEGTEGLGNLSSSDFLIPRIGIVGDLSPVLKKNNSAYIPNAEVGDIVDIGMGEVYKEGISFLPVARVKEWIQWAPRASGEGITGRFDYDIIKELGLERNDKNEFLIKDGPYKGNEVIETVQWYGLNLTAGGRRSFIPMKKSNLKVSRKWTGWINDEVLPNGKKPKIFWREYQLGTFQESKKSFDWFNWTIAKGVTLPEVPNWQTLAATAKEFQEQIEAGLVQGVDDERDEAPSVETPF